MAAIKAAQLGLKVRVIRKKLHFTGTETFIRVDGVC